MNLPPRALHRRRQSHWGISARLPAFVRRHSRAWPLPGPPLPRISNGAYAAGVSRRRSLIADSARTDAITVPLWSSAGTITPRSAESDRMSWYSRTSVSKSCRARRSRPADAPAHLLSRIIGRSSSAVIQAIDSIDILRPPWDSPLVPRMLAPGENAIPIRSRSHGMQPTQQVDRLVQFCCRFIKLPRRKQGFGIFQPRRRIVRRIADGLVQLCRASPRSL